MQGATNGTFETANSTERAWNTLRTALLPAVTLFPRYLRKPVGECSQSQMI